MNRWARFSGILGLVLFLFGIIGGFIVSFRVSLMVMHMILGLALIVYWFFAQGLKSISETPAVITGRGSRYGINALLYFIVFMSILVAINWIASRPAWLKRWDVTEQKLHSLSDQSIKIVSALDKPLRLVAFIGKDTGSPFHETLKLYGLANSKVRVEFVDPNSKPHLIEKYKMKEGNLVYIGYGPEDKPLGDSRVNDIKEDAITNAIIKLTKGAAKKIYSVVGHDEPSIKDSNRFGIKTLADAISDEHLALDTLLLAQVGKVPDDASAVMLISPKKALLPEEREMLVKYAEEGGHLILMTDPKFPAASDDVREIAAKFGITVHEDVVLDQVNRLFMGPAIGAQPVSRQYGPHDITRGMTEQEPTVFNLASSLSSESDNTSGGKPSDGAVRIELVKTGPAAWGETNLNSLLGSDEPSAAQDDNDIRGPLTLAMTYEKPLSDKAEDKKVAESDVTSEPSDKKVSRVVVFGDSDWVLNANFNVYANRDLILNTVNWVAGEESGISIRPKSQRVSQAPIEKSTYLALLTSSFVFPELLLIIGLAIWWKRRTAVTA